MEFCLKFRLQSEPRTTLPTADQFPHLLNAPSMLIFTQPQLGGFHLLNSTRSHLILHRLVTTLQILVAKHSNILTNSSAELLLLLFF